MSLIKNDKNITILTPSGFQPFIGLQKLHERHLFRHAFIVDDVRKTISTTDNHPFPVYDVNGIYRGIVKACNLTGDDYVQMDTGVLAQYDGSYYIGVDDVYDVLEVGGNNTFYADGILTHNCKFISSDALLIDTNVLQALNDVVSPPIYVSKKHLIQFWEPLKPNKIYMVGVDPSTGSGGDYSVIQIYSFPELNQVGMYRSNTMSSPELYIILKDILTAVEKAGSKSYFSIENNGVGEGIISMYRADERPPMTADFISEGGKRLGFTTTNRSKLIACILLKDMIEKDSMAVNSPQFLSELKSFVKKNQNYAAQFGSTDDCITAVMVVLRIMESIVSYDQSAFEKMFSERSRKAASHLKNNHGDINEPLPYAT